MDHGTGGGVDPQKIEPHFGTHIVIKTLDGSSCKKFIISVSATYIWKTHEQFKKMFFCVDFSFCCVTKQLVDSME